MTADPMQRARKIVQTRLGAETNGEVFKIIRVADLRLILDALLTREEEVRGEERERAARMCINLSEDLRVQRGSTIHNALWRTAAAIRADREGVK